LNSPTAKTSRERDKLISAVNDDRSMLASFGIGNEGKYEKKEFVQRRLVRTDGEGIEDRMTIEKYAIGLKS